ncbi:hypothetical protein PAPYR_6802 [Paratrimastix pyriformis]|uniref:Virilizer N-terminal domain-containing protein n=1 Tax=Paratrimastix pyriformis TaxID=342808 RepID=A0ABQ8UEI6_9EUKA|nr:hypothetical protein PAPYR_6802 [Paratrimastix pyriformis]
MFLLSINDSDLQTKGVPANSLHPADLATKDRIEVAQFQTPVMIQEIRVIPTGTCPHPAIDPFIGISSPARVALDFFSDDLQVPDQCVFTPLVGERPMVYDESSPESHHLVTSPQCRQRPVTRLLVRGLFASLSLCPAKDQAEGAAAPGATAPQPPEPARPALPRTLAEAAPPAPPKSQAPLLPEAQQLPVGPPPPSGPAPVPKGTPQATNPQPQPHPPQPQPQPPLPSPPQPQPGSIIPPPADDDALPLHGESPPPPEQQQQQPPSPVKAAAAAPPPPPPPPPPPQGSGLDEDDDLLDVETVEREAARLQMPAGAAVVALGLDALTQESPSPPPPPPPPASPRPPSPPEEQPAPAEPLVPGLPAKPRRRPRAPPRHLPAAHPGTATAAAAQGVRLPRAGYTAPALSPGEELADDDHDDGAAAAAGWPFPMRPQAFAALGLPAGPAPPPAPAALAALWAWHWAQAPADQPPRPDVVAAAADDDDADDDADVRGARGFELLTEALRTGRRPAGVPDPGSPEGRRLGTAMGTPRQACGALWAALLAVLERGVVEQALVRARELGPTQGQGGDAVVVVEEAEEEEEEGPRKRVALRAVGTHDQLASRCLGPDEAASRRLVGLLVRLLAAGCAQGAPRLAVAAAGALAAWAGQGAVLAALGEEVLAVPCPAHPPFRPRPPASGRRPAPPGRALHASIITGTPAIDGDDTGDQQHQQHAGQGEEAVVVALAALQGLVAFLAAPLPCSPEDPAGCCCCQCPEIPAALRLCPRHARVLAQTGVIPAARDLLQTACRSAPRLRGAAYECVRALVLLLLSSPAGLGALGVAPGPLAALVDELEAGAAAEGRDPGPLFLVRPPLVGYAPPVRPACPPVALGRPGGPLWRGALSRVPMTVFSRALAAARAEDAAAAAAAEPAPTGRRVWSDEATTWAASGQTVDPGALARLIRLHVGAASLLGRLARGPPGLQAALLAELHAYTRSPAARCALACALGYWPTLGETLVGLLGAALDQAGRGGAPVVWGRVGLLTDVVAAWADVALGPWGGPTGCPHTRQALLGLLPRLGPQLAALSTLPAPRPFPPLAAPSPSPSAPATPPNPHPDPAALLGSCPSLHLAAAAAALTERCSALLAALAPQPGPQPLGQGHEPTDPIIPASGAAGWSGLHDALLAEAHTALGLAVHRVPRTTRLGLWRWWDLPPHGTNHGHGWGDPTLCAAPAGGCLAVVTQTQPQPQPQPGLPPAALPALPAQAPLALPQARAFTAILAAAPAALRAAQHEGGQRAGGQQMKEETPALPAAPAAGPSLESILEASRAALAVVRRCGAVLGGDGDPRGRPEHGPEGGAAAGLLAASIEESEGESAPGGRRSPIPAPWSLPVSPSAAPASSSSSPLHPTTSEPPAAAAATSQLAAPNNNSEVTPAAADAAASTAAAGPVGGSASETLSLRLEAHLEALGAAVQALREIGAAVGADGSGLAVAPHAAPPQAPLYRDPLAPPPTAAGPAPSRFTVTARCALDAVCDLPAALARPPPPRPGGLAPPARLLIDCLTAALDGPPRHWHPALTLLERLLPALPQDCAALMALPATRLSGPPDPTSRPFGSPWTGPGRALNGLALGRLMALTPGSQALAQAAPLAPLLGALCALVESTDRALHLAACRCLAAVALRWPAPTTTATTTIHAPATTTTTTTTTTIPAPVPVPASVPAPAPVPAGGQGQGGVTTDHVTGHPPCPVPAAPTTAAAAPNPRSTPADESSPPVPAAPAGPIPQAPAAPGPEALLGPGFCLVTALVATLAALTRVLSALTALSRTPAGRLLLLSYEALPAPPSPPPAAPATVPFHPATIPRAPLGCFMSASMPTLDTTTAPEATVGGTTAIAAMPLCPLGSGSRAEIIAAATPLHMLGLT